MTDDQQPQSPEPPRDEAQPPLTQQPQQPFAQPQPQQVQQPQQQQPQWIPVPPQHPHASGARSTGKGLGIAAMCVGLIALLTAVVSTLYFSFALAAVLGVLLGLVAVVLGIVALVKKQRPIAPGVTGLAIGALTVVLALVVGVAGLGALAISSITGDEAGWDSESEGEGGEGTEVPEDSSALIDWPANMATGGIIFGEGLQPLRSEPLQRGESPQSAPIDRENGPADIRLYVDYRCPYCMLFEEENGDYLAMIAENGSATLELIPLTFLDRVSQGSYYSSRASGAVACVVDAQPEAAWDAHATLLSEEVQPAENLPGLSNDELIAVLDDAVGGLDPEVRSCITSERFVPFAQALNDWVFANVVPNASESSLQVTGTPFVVVNGDPYLGSPSDQAAFTAFLAEHGL